MKKIIVMAMFVIIATGCLYDEKDKKNIIVEEIKNMDFYNDQDYRNLVELNDTTIESEIGLNVSDLEDYSGMVSYPLDANFYLIVKPKKTSKNSVKKAIELYIDNLKQRIILTENLNINEENIDSENEKIAIINNMLIEEYNDYLIYVSTNNNEDILSIIKENIK